VTGDTGRCGAVGPWGPCEAPPHGDDLKHYVTRGPFSYDQVQLVPPRKANAFRPNHCGVPDCYVCTGRLK
jgi:hypothetical protein